MREKYPINLDTMKQVERKMNRWFGLKHILLILTAAIVLSGCVTQAVAYGGERAMATMTAEAKNHTPPTQAASQSAAPNPATGDSGAAAPQTASDQPADVSYTLTTGMGPNGMAFVGKGGAIDGVANPELKAQSGQVVEIILINGDNILHNLAIPTFGVQSPDVAKQGDETRVTFQATQAGAIEYYCNVPGHKQAGMLGQLTVAPGEGQQAAQPASAPYAASAAMAGDMNMAQPTAAPAPAAPVDTTNLPSVVRDPADLPGPLDYTTPQTVTVDLETSEVTARLADGVSYTYWTFNGKVPGPFVRVRVGDTVQVNLKNMATSSMAHSVDFHAATGPGGGAVATQTKPGEETHVTFKALNPGLYVYHCATPMVAQHISNGMYGLILVEPEGGLPPVDHEYYVMQGELYTVQPYGQKGAATFDENRLLDELPTYYVLNGAVGGLTDQFQLKANVGETVRIFYGVGGPNKISSFHIIGEIFDRVFDQASITAAPLTDVQTTLVPSGGATMVELTVQVPGRYLLVDHAISRLQRGLLGYLLVEGPDNPEIYQGTPTGGSGH